MTCCKHEEFENCYGQPNITWEGQTYCLFHAPADCPEKQGGENIRNFNKLVYERIEEAQKARGACYLSGTVFPGHIRFQQFDGNNQLPTVFFDRSIFCKDVYFTNAHFSNVVNFSYAIFKELAEFSDAIFESIAHFNDIELVEDIARFERTEFKETAYFTNAKFKKGANFNDAKFGAGLYFDSAIFNRNASFSRT